MNFCHYWAKDLDYMSLMLLLPTFYCNEKPSRVLVREAPQGSVYKHRANSDRICDEACPSFDKNTESWYQLANCKVIQFLSFPKKLLLRYVGPFVIHYKITLTHIYWTYQHLCSWNRNFTPTILSLSSCSPIVCTGKNLLPILIILRFSRI